MPISMKIILMFFLDNVDTLGLEGESSDILMQIRQSKDSEGMVPWHIFANLLDDKTIQLFRTFEKELSRKH